MRNSETITLCLDVSRKRCLHVWQFLSGEQVGRYYREWLSGEGREDELALFSSLAAIGARYVSGDPTCAHANTLFMNSQELSLLAASFGISATGMAAKYVQVYVKLAIV